MVWLEEQQKQLKKLNDMMMNGNKFLLFFRGVSDSTYQNVPSIYRDGLIENEDVIFKECLCRNSDDFAKERTTFDKLVKMQHYGIPTRLLDITTNPLVALYFACRKTKSKNNGAVFAFYISERSIKYSDSDTVSAVANLALRPYAQMTISGLGKSYDAYIYAMGAGRYTKQYSTYENYRNDFNKQEAIIYLVNDIRSEKAYFQAIIRPEHLETIWCVRPKLNNNRIIRQDGAFLLFGILVNKSNPLRIPTIGLAKKYFEISNTLKALIECYDWTEKKISDDDYKKLEDALFFECQLSFIPRDFIRPLKNADIAIYELCKLPRKLKLRILRDNAERKETFCRKFQEIQQAKNLESTENVKDNSKEMQSLLINITDNNLFCSCLQRNDPLIFADSIETENKNQLNRDLEAFAITEDKLFPELDHVAEFLKDKYKKAGDDLQ